MKKNKIKRVGRPSKPDNEKNVRLSFSCSKTQEKKMNEKAKLLFGGSLSKYIIHELFKNPSKTVKIKSNP